MKKCPFCAEEIQDAAIVCKHCGRELRPQWETEARALAAAGNKIKAIQKVREGNGTSLGDAKTMVESWGGPTAPAAAAKNTGCATWLVGIVLALMVVGYCSSANQPTPSSSSSTSTPARSAARKTAPPRDASPVIEVLSKRGSPSDGGGYYTVEGEIKNLTTAPLEAIQVVATWYTDDGTMITSDSAMIEYNPLMPGQTSPYKTMSRANPLMKKFNVEFKPIFGSPLPTKDSSK